eukprot:TRINITY_DN32165_c0_g1_i1.p1 TRINITY_DN32165_c0_g1~~TRINITY_DN32165_c0_g1_i1.p1  ORF type:complete len:157 (+),score=37.76 TRINITY_DN32165_c0_g1_i1:30-473(+)
MPIPTRDSPVAVRLSSMEVTEGFLSPKDTRKKETVERLQALNAIEERRRHEEVEKKIAGLEGRLSDVEFEQREAIPSSVLSLIQAEICALKATVEFQGEEITRLNNELEAYKKPSPIPSPTNSTRDRSNPNWLSNWEHNVSAHLKRQ